MSKLDEIATRAFASPGCNRGCLDGNCVARHDRLDLVAALRAVEAVLTFRSQLWNAICSETCCKDIVGVNHDAIADKIAKAIETAIREALGS